MPHIFQLSILRACFAMEGFGDYPQLENNKNKSRSTMERKTNLSKRPREETELMDTQMARSSVAHTQSSTLWVAATLPSAV
jgi:hypothetical protein